MAKIGFHASHEQFTPRDLLTLVQRAEAAGFDGAMCSDHFAPWSERQGESGFAWAWLGAALQATRLTMGVVNAPGQRYHPAIIAQAAATLAQMFPGRFWITLGSGQALNEHITGDVWPSKELRNQRLKECAEIMRALWAGETVTHHGLVRVEGARLYTRPEAPPRLVGAALTPGTAEWVGGWADALITINQPQEKHHEVVEAFRRGGGAGKPVVLQVHLSYAETDEQARAYAHDQWRTNVFPSPVATVLPTPQHFDAAAQYVRPEDVEAHVRISADVDQHIAWIEADAAFGFDEIYLHNVGPNQAAFIDAFGKHVLPVVSPD